MAAGAVDNLNIQLQAQANQAVGSIDVLITRLTKLNNSLNNTNRSGLTGVANGVNKLGTAMQGMKSVGAADFTRLAKNISKISSLDTNGIQRAASAIGQISKSLGSLKSVSVSGTSKQVADLAIGISRLGYKSSTKAIENIPKLATAMNGLMASLSKAPRVSQNLIDMTSALGRLAKTGASSGKAASSLSRSLNSYTQSADRASKSSKGFASALGKMYATYWLIFRAFGKIGDSIEIASDLVEVQNVVDTVFGDMSGKVEQYAQNSIKQFGMSELAFKQYSSRFQAMGAAMGIDSTSVGQANKFLNEQTNGYVEMSDSMADVSINLTKLAADMASFYNVEQSAVAEDLAAIFTGETRPLRTYGLDLTQATLSEWAMKQGLDANIASMSQMEKTMLRYQYVLANTTAAQGDFVRTQDTWANQLRILQEQFKQFASVVGTGFIAAFKPVLQTLNNVMGKVISFTETVLNALGHIFGWQFEISGGGITDDLADSLESADVSTGDAAGNAGDLSGNLGEAAENAKKLYSTVLGIDELNINSPDTGTPGSSGSGGSSPSGGSGGGSGSGSGTGGGGLTTVMTRNDTILKAYESSIDTLYELGEYIGDTLTNVMNGIDWDSVYQGARNFGKGLADFLNGLISPELFGATGRTIAGALNAAIYAALSFGQTFDFYDFGVSIATGINEFFRTFDFAALAETLNVWVDGLINAIAGFLNTITWSDILNAAGDFLGTLELDTVGVIIGALTIKKVLSAGIASSVLSGIGSSIGGQIAGSIAANLGISFGSGGIKTALTGIGTSIGTTIVAGVKGLFGSQAATSALAFINPIITTITGIGSILGGVGIAVTNFFAMWEDGFSWLNEALMVLGVALGAVGAIVLGAPALVTGVIAAIVAAVGTIVVVVKDNWDSIVSFFTETIPAWWTGTALPFLQSIPERFLELVDSIVTFIAELPGKIGYWLGYALGSFATWVLNCWEYLTEKVPEIVNGIVTFIAELPGKIWNVLLLVIEKFGEWKDAAITFVTEKVPEIVNSVISFFKELPDKIFEIGKDIITGLWNGIQNAWEGIKNGVSDFVGGFVQGFRDAFDINSPSKVMSDDVGVYVLQGVVQPFDTESQFEAINRFASNLTNKLRQTMTGCMESIKQIFNTAPEYFRNVFTLASNNVKTAFQFMDSWFREKWNATKNVFSDVQSFFRTGFSNAYRAITSAFSGLSGFFRGIANDIIDPIGDAINGVIRGMNWLLDELGSSKNLSAWEVPKFASGSSGVPRDTVGVVNDQPGSTYRELIVPPSGNAFIPTGRNVMLPLEKGTKIMPAGQTKALFNGIPHFAKGIGRFFGNAWESAISYTGDPMDYFDSPEKLVQIAFDKFIDTSRWTGAIGNVGVGVINTIFDSAVSFIKKMFGSNKIEQAVRWAIGIANDNSHGYDQAHRTGPDYDCSSLVTIALKKAGFNIDVGTTSTMLGQLLGIGFSDVTSSVNRGTGANMRRGDVLLKPGAHTAMYAGNGQIVHARINEFGGITGGKTGDQTGDEIAVTPYHNHPWTYVLRYAKAYKNGIGRINLSDLIPAYSVGGFPEDGLFMANHNELVGRFDNGRTAVANNDNIQRGIKTGVKEAVSEILAPYLSQIANNTREFADKDLSYNIDGKRADSLLRRARSNSGYNFRTAGGTA